MGAQQGKEPVPPRLASVPVAAGEGGGPGPPVSRIKGLRSRPGTAGGGHRTAVPEGAPLSVGGVRSRSPFGESGKSRLISSLGSLGRRNRRGPVLEWTMRVEMRSQFDR